MEELPTEELSCRAEIFRSKLIEDFQLLDSLLSKGNVEAPRYYSNEIQDPGIMEKLLKESPHSLVKFQVCAKREELKFNDRRLNRVRNKSRIPFGPWAHTVTENQKIQNFIMFLIIANSVVLGIQAEIADNKSPTIIWLKVMFNIFDYITLVVFVMEILVKWIDGFWIFWQNGWNNFDFFVTAMSVIPEVMKLASGESSSQFAVIGDNMRVFKILRSLKMVSRFAQLRIIVLTILKAFKSMAFILMLLALFMYIFAVAGTIMFDSYAKSERMDLKYKNSFSTLKNANITLFQLFTLDHWYEVLTDMIKVVNPAVAKIYILLWICIGAFIFRNIFAGIMVNNFQNIRNDFNLQVKEQIASKEREEIRTQLVEELDKQDKMHDKSRRTSSLAPKENPSRRKNSFLHRVFKKSTPNIIDNIIEQPAEGQEGPLNQEPASEVFKQPEFVSHLQEKIARIRSKDTSLKPSSSFHAYYADKSKDKTISEHTNDMTNVEDSYIDHETKKVYFNETEMLKQTEVEINEELDLTDWAKTVDGNLHNFERFPMETLWPRDTLFKYFRLMESLQENLVERKQLMRLLVESLLQLNDSQDKTKLDKSDPYVMN